MKDAVNVTRSVEVDDKKIMTFWTHESTLGK